MVTKKTAAKSTSKKAPSPKAAATKKTTKKKTVSKQSSDTKKMQPWLAWLIKFSLKILLLVIAASALYAIYLDNKIQERFSGNKWQLPSQLYARPLQLEVGMRLSPRWLLDELALLRYQKVSKLTGPGQYTAWKNKIELIRRPFEFLHGSESKQFLKLTFKGHRLSKLSDGHSGKSISKAWLDPVLIDRMQTSQREDRLLVPFKQYPTLLLDTLLLVEDRSFYEHQGVSPMAIARAFYANIKAGRTVQGGSTLTQQLAKNFFLSSSRNLSRKVQEAAMALVMDFRYEKDEILETYLNEVYLGQNHASGVHGFGLASYFYFGRPVGELTIEQMATMVALVKGPSYYDPWRHPKRLLARRDLILRIMVEHNHIKSEQYKVAAAKPLDIMPRGQMNFGKTPAYVSLVRRELKMLFVDSFSHYQGVKVFSNLDPVAQKSAEQAITDKIISLPGHKDLEAAMVVTDRANGEVIALVAGKDPSFSGFNRALDSVRSIGSLVKPFVYLSALTKGYHLGSILDDKPISIASKGGKLWQPQNYNKQMRGQVPLYEALINSMNLPTVYLGLKVGVDVVIDNLMAAGLETRVKARPSVLLGSVNLSPYQVAQLYHTLSNQGAYQKIAAIAGVMTQEGEVLYKAKHPKTQVLPTQETYLTQYAMTLVTRKGTAKSLSWRLPKVNIAGKTGTTDNNRDSWFVGMDQRDLVTVWVGRDDSKGTKVTGSSGALPLFSEYMKNRAAESLRLPVPHGISWNHFDPKTGEATLPECAASTRLPAITDRLPAPKDCSLLGWGKSLLGF